MAYSTHGHGEWPGLFPDAQTQQLDGASDLPLDAFLLEGDERTWNLEDWSWDADGLRGVQEQTTGHAPCCEALQRGRQSIENMCPPHHQQHTQCHLGNLMGKPNWAQPQFHPGGTQQSGTVHPVMAHDGPWPQSYGPASLPAPPITPAQPPAEPVLHANSPVHANLWDQALVNPEQSAAEEGNGFPVPAAKKPCLDGAGCTALEHCLHGTPILKDPPPENENQMICQVEGCGADLTNLKEYHHRYHICDVHIRLPQVMRDGRLQRFCQQCGRFHDLVAFDSNRKSCRTQLMRHNARRRMRTKIDRVKAKSAVKGAENDDGLPSPAAPGRSDSVSSCMFPEPAAAAPVAAVDNLPTPTRRLSEPSTTVANGPPTSLAATDVSKLEGVGAGVAGNGKAVTGNSEADIGPLLSALMENPAQLNSLRLLLGIQTNPVLPQIHPFVPEAMTEQPAAKANGKSSSYMMAREMVDGKGRFGMEPPASEHASLRISMKLFARTPADLPLDIRSHITSWLASAPVAMEGLIRPGCVFLTVQLLLDLESYEQAVASGVQGLVNHLLHKTDCYFWREGMYTVQVESELASLTNGLVTGIFKADKLQHAPQDLCSIVPGLFSVSPVCVTASSALSGSVPITLRGSNLDTRGLTVFTRQAGQQLKSVLWIDSNGTASTSVPALSECGVAMIEIARNAYLTQALPVLVVEDPLIAQEVCSLESMGLPTSVMSSILVDLSAVLYRKSYPSASLGRSLDGQAALLTKAKQLLFFACDNGWSAVAKALLPLTGIAVGCYVTKSGLSPLHCAVRSGNLATVQALVAHATQDHSIRADQWGLQGITPLHLSALIPDVKIMLALLNPKVCPRHTDMFTQLVADDGITPFHMALQMGHFDLTHVIKALSWSQVAPFTGEQPKLIRMPKAHKYASEVDPCERCHSAVPPLVLSISASCYTCGTTRPCLSDDECNDRAGDNDATVISTVHLPCDKTATLPKAACAPSTCAMNNEAVGLIPQPPPNQGPGHKSGGQPAGQVESLLPQEPPKLKCEHRLKDTLYRIQALCQGCHINRSLVAT